MAHIHSIYDTDKHFRIDGVKRTITNEVDVKNLIVQHDHNSERFTFELPRFIDGHDMSTCNVVQVHYINISSTVGEKSYGVYECDDLQVSPDSDDVVICSWLISQNATKYVGNLSFVLRFVCSNLGEVDYAWNTTTFSLVNVASGIYNGDVVVEEYADILAEWEARLDALEAGGGMGGADWNAAEGEPGHVANRTHWVDREEVPLNFTFDGDITGKETINTGGAMLVKVSNAILSMDDFIGATVTMSDGSVMEVSSDLVFDILGDGSLIGNDGFFAAQRNCMFNGIAFTAGLYFVYMESDGFTMYTQSLVKEGATVMSEIVHKLDAKFLPDNIGGNGGVFLVMGDTSSMTADKTTDEIMEAMLGGKTVLLAIGNHVLPCVGCEPGRGAFFLAIGAATSSDGYYDIVSLGLVWIKPDGSIVLKPKF